MAARHADRDRLLADKNKVLALDVPEPVVLKNDSACKALKLMSNGETLLCGLDSGMVRVINANTMQIIAESQLMSEPVLKIDHVQEAILVQYRDKNGSIVLC